MPDPAADRTRPAAAADPAPTGGRRRGSAGLDSGLVAHSGNGAWRSLVARFVRDEEAVGSNPATPTMVLSQDICTARTTIKVSGACPAFPITHAVSVRIVASGGHENRTGA